MHASKMLVYGHFISFDASAWKLAGILSVGMVLGSWLGKKTVERLSVEKFRTVRSCLLIALALQMLVAG
jgi:uncharacterized membrane protein YfcA